MDDQGQPGRRKCFAIKKKSKRNPARPQYRLAKEMNLSQSSVQRALTKDLNLKPFKKIKSQNLTAANIEKLFLRSKALLRRFTTPKSNNILLSDEKIFTLEEKYNSQNSRVYGVKKEDFLKKN